MASWKSSTPGDAAPAGASIRLRGIQSACTATRGCASALATSRSQMRCQAARSSAVQATPNSRPTHHSGNNASSRPSSAASQGGKASAGTPLLPAQQGRQRVAHQAVGLRRRGGLQGVEVEVTAEVGEQQEAVVDIGFQDARRMQPGGGGEAGHVYERPHVFLWRRRVHHDQAAAVGGGGVGVQAQVAAKARIGRSGGQAVEAQAVARRDGGDPALEGRLARGMAPDDLRGGNGHG